MQTCLRLRFACFTSLFLSPHKAPSSLFDPPILSSCIQHTVSLLMPAFPSIIFCDIIFVLSPPSASLHPSIHAPFFPLLFLIASHESSVPVSPIKTGVQLRNINYTLVQSPFIGAQTIVFLKRAISLSLLRVFSILYVDCGICPLLSMPMMKR